MDTTQAAKARPKKIIRLGIPAEAMDALLVAADREAIRAKDKARAYIVGGLRAEAYLPLSPDDDETPWQSEAEAEAAAEMAAEATKKAARGIL